MTDTTTLLSHCDEAVRSAERLLAAAKSRVAAKVSRDGRVHGAKLDSEQHAAHGLAWFATYVECLRQLVRWARTLNDEKRLGEIERLLLEAGMGEYLAQIAGGIPMSQNEIVRPLDLGLSEEET